MRKLIYALLAAATIIATASPPAAAHDPSGSWTPKLVTGDFNGDGKTDLAVTGVPGLSFVAVALSTGGGQFSSSAWHTQPFADLASTPGAKLVTGDFNGDRKTDLALTGVAGWDSIPVAFSLGNGQFTTTALSTPLFPGLAATPGSKLVTGDFNGDRKTDLALTGVPGWDSIPVAFSTGGGQFNTTALSTPLFPGLSANPRAQLVAGDFNADQMTDLALTGVPGWDSIPVAFSTGGGQFNSTALSTPLFPALAANPWARLVTGDFNADRKTDLALTGVPGWDSIPVAFSTGGGQFNSTALSTPLFPALAVTPGAKLLSGDFNGDQMTDLALTGVPGWDSVPVAFSTGGGQFNSTALATPLFPALAANPWAKAVVGYFNDDRNSDLALTGVPEWDCVPVAFSTGGGQFNSTALTTPLFPSLARRAVINYTDVAGD